MANSFDIASFNLVNWANSVADLYDSTPKDVEIIQKDNNGNLFTKDIANRGKFKQQLWDDVGGALGQFNRRVYVDADNGDDNNSGDSDHPFKTIDKAVDSTPIGGTVDITLKTDYTMNSNINIRHRYVAINITDGVKLNGKWYTYNSKARLYFFDFSQGYLQFYIKQTDSNGEPSQIIIPENDTGNNKDSEYIQFLFYNSSSTGVCKISYVNKVSDAKVIEVNDGYLLKVYTWAKANGLVDLRIQKYYSGSKIMVNTDNVSHFINFEGSPSSFVWQVDSDTLIDQNGNDLDIKDQTGGITKDVDSGNPINLISNINFSD